MLKTILFIILVMLMKPVLAASMMSHEKFVQLNYEEQKKIVISIMEFVAETESKYQKQVKTSGFDPERFRKYTDFLRTVSNLIFPEAHAVRYERSGQYLHDLRSITNESNRCLYAGWISSMVGNKCTHPSNSPFKKFYAAETGCMGGVNQITCNPAIFGFKKASARTLFCVKAGEGQSDNSSRDCMLEALKETSSATVDSRETRIRLLIQGIKDNPLDSNKVFDFLLQACVCDATKSPQISEHYANYMRPHQTCYAILKMMSEVTTAPECITNGEPLMSVEQKSFLDDIKGILSTTDVVSANVTALYKAKVDQFVSRPDYQAICRTTPGGNTGGGPTPRPETPTTESDCNPTTHLKPNGDVCCPSGQHADADQKCVPDDGVTVDDTRTPPTDPNPGPTTGPGPGTTDNPGPTTPTTTNTCTAPKVAEGQDGACVDPCSADKVRNPTTHACDPKPAACEKPEQVREGPEDSCVDACKDDEERDPETHACKKKPADATDTSVSITVTGKDKDTSTTTVTTTINPAETDWTQYILIWFSRGETRATDQNVSGTRTSPPTASISSSDPGEETPEDHSRDLGDKESIINRDDQKTLDAPRLSNDYEMCARLIKKSDNSKTDEKCAKIPKKPVQAPARNNGMNPFGPQQMGPTRGGPSDAVFRGVR